MRSLLPARTGGTPRVATVPSGRKEQPPDRLDFSFGLRRGPLKPKPLKIVLLCHFGRTGYNILRSLRSIGAEVFIVYDSHSASLRYSRACTILQTVDEIGTADQDSVIHAINELHVARGVDSVIATDVDSMTLLSAIRDRLLAPVFPMSELPTLLALNNKWEFHKLCEANGVAVPRTLFYESRSAVDPDAVERELGFPVIVKPAASYGQRGIVILPDRAALVDRFLAAGGQDYPGLVIQEYLEGRDWALSVFAREGKIEHWAAWVCPGQLDGAYGVGRFLATEFDDRIDFFEMAQAIVSAVNYSGVANFDARHDTKSDSIKMLECNPRFFNRLSAARLCGLDFVRAGLPAPIVQRVSIGSVTYYPWQELFSRRGLARLFSGGWRLGPLARDLCEMATDPLPPIMRKLAREDQIP
jgi:predicted ATP-grasp superfamily ATP-dependent carboligase